METKKVFSTLGFALFTLLLVTIITSVVFELIAMAIIGEFPSLGANQWFEWMMMDPPVFIIGFLVFYNMTKKIPDGPKGDPKKMSLNDFFIGLIITFGAMYIFSMAGGIINMFIESMKGSAVTDPVADVIDSTGVLISIVFISILTPIYEEVIFRGILLNKLRVYGDKIAIFFSAFIFGIYHGNLPQFLYAFAVGLVWGYIVVKTNRIKYTVIFHMIINLSGSVIIPFMGDSEIEMLNFMVVFFVLGMSVLAFMFFMTNLHNIRFEPAIIEINPMGKFKTMYLNAGMIFFLTPCFLEMLLVILTPT